MNMYHWSSKLLANHSEGDIVVMAENKEQARQFAEIQGHRYILENNAYLTMLRENEDPDYDVELDEELQVLRADLAAEPAIIPSGVILIPGSD